VDFDWFGAEMLSPQTEKISKDKLMADVGGRREE